MCPRTPMAAFVSLNPTETTLILNWVVSVTRIVTTATTIVWSLVLLCSNANLSGTYAKTERGYQNCTRVSELYTLSRMHTCIRTAHVHQNCTRVSELHTCITTAHVQQNCARVAELHTLIKSAHVCQGIETHTAIKHYSAATIHAYLHVHRAACFTWQCSLLWGIGDWWLQSVIWPCTV